MSKIIGQSLPNIPWEEKPEGYRMPLWRYSGNPIIGRDGNRVSNSVFNSAIVPLRTGLRECSAATAVQSVWIFLSEEVRTESTGKSKIRRCSLPERTERF